MAYLLRSNISVNDPDGRFPFYGRYGITHKELAIFMQDMEQQGYIVEQSEFTALDTFISNLKSSSIWDKVYECYPIMGNGALSAAVKLKDKEGGRIMTAVDGFDDSILETLSGKVLGKDTTTASTSGGAPRLSTGLTVNSLLPGCGLHFYGGGAGDIGGNQPVLGTMQSTSSAGISTQLAINTVVDGFRNSFCRPPGASLDGNTTLNEFGLHGVIFEPNPNAIGASTKQVYYRDGSLVSASGFQAITNEGFDAELAIFGRNTYGGATGASTSTGYSGKVRFACVTDGFLTAQQVSTLHSEINTLVSALGKSFV